MIGSLLKVFGICLVGLKTTCNNDVITKPYDEPQYVVVGINNQNSLRFDSYASYRLWLFLGANSSDVTRNVTYYNTHIENPANFDSKYVGSRVVSSVPLLHVSGHLNGYDVQNALDDDNGAVYNMEVGESSGEPYLRLYKADFDDFIQLTAINLSNNDTELTIEPVPYLKEYLESDSVNITMTYNIYDNVVYYPFTLLDGVNSPYFTNEREITPTPPSYDEPYGDNSLYGVFGLIYNGFLAVSSVFMISVIPGVSIGTLFVLPLVVLLIIFIVNLFKR